MKLWVRITGSVSLERRNRLWSRMTVYEYMGRVILELPEPFQSWALRAMQGVPASANMMTWYLSLEGEMRNLASEDRVNWHTLRTAPCPN